MSDLRTPEYPRREQSFKNTSSAQLAMYIGLASLTMFFGASLLGMLITRAQSDNWRHPGLPGPPDGLWVSTVLLVALSIALHYSQRMLARNNQTNFLRGLLVALVLGGAFLLAQVQNWRSLAVAVAGAEVKSLYIYCFYFLTGLHAVHVVAGVIPLFVVRGRAKRNEYSSSRNGGVILLRQYWDFLFVIWFILVAVLWL